MYETVFDILGAAKPRNRAHPVGFFLNVMHCFTEIEGKQAGYKRVSGSCDTG